eukprot:TRINITY_DN21425_c0_g1_i1.p1 TRINITY_DN21425_c0_g1~~TRINITY_DN21425_c0_g1_i1.p1  ORF type:complete len:359 (+),score=112.00 TRINITY_DN21425_c0_g1_i1:82-1158(+)
MDRPNVSDGGKRVYKPGEIIVHEYGCKNVGTLESPYTETGSGAALLKDAPQFTMLKKKRSNRNDVPANEESLEFELSGVSPAVANLFRRTMLMEVDTVAVDVVVIHENDGAIFDEALAHRIGLVPLNVDADLVSPVVGKVNTGLVDPQTTLKFIIDVKADRDNYPVYSSDLVYTSTEGSPAFPETPAPVHKRILLAKLAKGNRIRAECYAIKGCGEQHAKWSATAAVSYKPQPTVNVVASSPNARGESAAFISTRCPGKVFDIEDGDLVSRRPQDCTMCRECIRSDHPQTNPSPVELGLEKTRFRFLIESIGVYTCEDIFRRAMVKYAAKLRGLSKEVQTSWPTQLTEQLDPSREDYL